jgi:alanine racemase
MRSTVAYLSSSNLLHNLQIIKQTTNNAKIIAMVKANAYGHGLRSVALKLEKHIDFLGVASIDEALQLRKVGIVIPIILMEGVFEPQELPIALENNFPIVFSWCLSNVLYLDKISEIFSIFLNKFSHAKISSRSINEFLLRTSKFIEQI